MGKSKIKIPENFIRSFKCEVGVYLKLKNNYIEIDFIIDKIFSSPEEAFLYKFSAFFIKENSEIIIKIIDDFTKEIVSSFTWRDCRKYQMKIADRIEDSDEENQWRHFASTFDNLFKTNNIQLEEREAYILPVDRVKVVPIINYDSFFVESSDLCFFEDKILN